MLVHQNFIYISKFYKFNIVILSTIIHLIIEIFLFFLTTLLITLYDKLKKM
jgi:hypothetical protein